MVKRLTASQENAGSSPAPRLEVKMSKEWWKDKREVIWRIKALASQLRVKPNALTEDLDARIKLNKIGKAIEELAECLLALEGVGLEIKEEPKWYESVMLFFGK